jgi:sulfane dehydrogenase subunit SoxC
MADINDMTVAGNGLLNRRLFLQSGAAGTAALLTAQAPAQENPQWMNVPGAGMSESGAPSRYETELYRRSIQSQPGTTGTGVSRTPLEYLDGIITPSRLHFERHHSGIPDIDPDRHKLIIQAPA